MNRCQKKTKSATFPIDFAKRFCPLAKNSFDTNFSNFQLCFIVFWQICNKSDIGSSAQWYCAAYKSANTTKLHCTKFKNQWTMGQRGNDRIIAIQFETWRTICDSNFSHRMHLFDIREWFTFYNVCTSNPIRSCDMRSIDRRCTWWRYWTSSDQGKYE